MKKLNTKGFSHHFVLPILAIFIVAGIGTYMVTKSSAYSYISGWTPYTCTQDPTPTLRYGSRGNCVKALQYLLNKWIAYKRVPIRPLTIDGQFGSRTKDAVIRFQRMYGLTADGIVGKMTWSKMTSTGGCNILWSCTGKG